MELSRALVAVGYVLGLFAVAALILTVRDRLARRRPAAPEEQAAEDAARRRYYVEAGPRGEDGPVSVHYHDGGDVVRISDTLEEFLSWPRRPDRPHLDADA